MLHKQKLIDLISDHEGVKLKVYDDATGQELKAGDVLVGHPTIGIGRNVAKDGLGISQEEAEENFKLTQHNDKLKNDFCKVYGYKMIRIPYTEITNILGILHNELEEILEF